MTDFSKYFLMINEDKPEETEKLVIEYTLLKTKGKGEGKIDWDEDTMQAKIPAAHGNLNHVCRVMDGKGHSLYIKQAGVGNTSDRREIGTGYGSSHLFL